MTIIPTIWGIASAFIGLMIFIASPSAVHEIEAAIAFLIATVAIGSAAI